MKNNIIIGTAITETSLSSNQTVDDYSYIIATDMIVNPLVIARCIIGLGPSGDENSELGGWFFNGTVVPSGDCNDSNVIESNGAAISDYIGVIDLFQCGTFSNFSEGVYTCTIIETNNAVMEQSIRLGVYFTERSELLNMHSITLFLNVSIQLLQP